MLLIVQSWLKWVKKETQRDNGRCLVCKQLEFFRGIPDENWLTEQRTRTINKKCYGPGATCPFRVASKRVSERRSREGRRKRRALIFFPRTLLPRLVLRGYVPWPLRAPTPLYCGQLQTPSQSLLGKYVIFAITTQPLSFNASASY